MDVGRLIKSDDCVTEGAAWLATQDPRFARALELTGPLPLRLRPDGFDQLLSAIVSQQVSVASAAAIWKRMQDAGLVSPEAIVAASEDDLRGAGLSRQKMRYARALAAEGIDFEALRTAPNEKIFATLTNVSGIGIWTAEIYAMFSLALQESARMLFGLDERPKERALRQMAEVWSPWRSVAARLLWAYYRVDKGREGVGK